jgi:hypothetical protein
MSFSVDDLEGKYIVKSETSDGGPYIVNGDGETEIRNGLTFRLDRNGFIWESSFSVMGPKLVLMESTLDPSRAGDDAYIKDEKGNPTKAIVTYRTVLEVGYESDRLVMEGIIEHGGETTRVKLIKV